MESLGNPIYFEGISTAPLSIGMEDDDGSGSLIQKKIDRLLAMFGPAKSDLVGNLREIESADLDRVYRLEVDSYPADEAATREKLFYRFIFAKRYFQCFVVDGKVIGFVCGTKATEPVLTEHTMAVHEETGRHLMIHSVVIDGEYRKRGYGLRMMTEYVTVQQRESGLLSIRLVCKQKLIPFYSKAGFRLVGKSDLELFVMWK